MGANAARQVSLGQVALRILGQTRYTALRWHYPYCGELTTPNAWEGAGALQRDMANVANWCSVSSNDGTESLVKALANDLIRHGTIIVTGIIAVGMKRADMQWVIDTKLTHSMRYGNTITAQRVIISSREAAEALYPVPQIRTALAAVAPRPMVRMYIAYPKDNSGIYWTDGLPTFSTNTPIRYIIPYGPGRLMISIDAEDAIPWMQLSSAAARTAVIKQLKALTGIKAPAPIYFAIHPWPHVGSFWRPGFAPGPVNRGLQHIAVRDNVFIVGEWRSSTHQAWMEGAIRSVTDAGL